MKADFKLVIPDLVEATVTLSAPVSEWRKLLGQMEESDYRIYWPTSSVIPAISKVVRAAEEHFDAEGDADAAR